MQGFIINLNKVKEEDLIVTILSKENLYTLYRFYGARHGSINIGFLIDFEQESSAKSSISRLKDVIHIGYKWINNYNSLRLWQDFSSLFFKHLKDSEELDTFYFDLLKQASLDWNKQNPKRVAIEAYVKLLSKEGRLHLELNCFLCSNEIKNQTSLLRGYLPTHKECSHKKPINTDALVELFKNHSTLFMEDNEVNILWNTLLEGL